VLATVKNGTKAAAVDAAAHIATEDNVDAHQLSIAMGNIRCLPPFVVRSEEPFASGRARARRPGR
jgi:hypothetical protein